MESLVHKAFEKNRKTVICSTLHGHLQAMHRACHEAFGIAGRSMADHLAALRRYRAAVAVAL